MIIEAFIAFRQVLSNAHSVYFLFSLDVVIYELFYILSKLSDRGIQSLPKNSTNRRTF